MSKYFLLFFTLVFSLPASARKSDSLFVKQFKDSWTLTHQIKKGESVFSIARRYHVPPVKLAEFNNIGFQQDLSQKDKLFVPLGAFNLIKKPPKTYSSEEVRPLYYKANDYVSFSHLAKLSDVSYRHLQDWNKTNMLSVLAGQVVIVGWVLYDPTEAPVAANREGSSIKVVEENSFPAANQDRYEIVATIPAEDTLANLPEGQREYLIQTGNDVYVVNEKGTAAFFNGKGSDGVYFALHNIAPRGTILKVTNPGTSKVIYAKVIGKVPETRNYHNAILGLSQDAKRELLVSGEKVWCVISYKQ